MPPDQPPLPPGNPPPIPLHHPANVLPAMNEVHVKCNVTTAAAYTATHSHMRRLLRTAVSWPVSSTRRGIAACEGPYKRLMRDITKAADRNFSGWWVTMRNAHQNHATMLISTAMLHILPALQHKLKTYRTTESDRLHGVLTAICHDPLAAHVGVARVLYTKVVAPAINAGIIELRDDLDPQQDRGASKAPTVDMIQRKIRAGYPARALDMARRARDQGAELQHRPTVQELRDVTHSKFPTPTAEERAAMPTADDLPPMDADGTIRWADDPIEQEAQKAEYGGDSFRLTVEEIMKQIPKLNIQKAQGTARVTNRYLRQFFEHQEGAVEQTLVPFFNMMISGRLPRDVMRLSLTMRLVLIPKKTGPNDEPKYRPLGLLDALMRLMNKTIATKFKNICRDALQPHQYAVGVSDGTVALAAKMQALFDLGRTILASDIINAYNTVKRSIIKKALQERCPALLRWFIVSYGENQELWMSDGEHVGDCQTGVVQGDPLSMQYFCWSFHDTLVEIRQDLVEAHEAAGLETAHVSVDAFADDMYNTGNCVVLAESMARSAAKIRDNMGAEVSLEKWTMLIGANTDPEDINKAREIAEAQGATVVTDGMIVMGIPVGTDDYIEAAGAELLLKYQRDLPLLQYFTVQQQLCVLMYCITARPAFLQRALRPDVLQDRFEGFDEAVTVALESVIAMDGEALHHQYHNRIHAMRRLPQRLGGMGMRAMATPYEREHAFFRANVRIKAHFQEDGATLAAMAESRWHGDFTHNTVVPTPWFADQPRPDDPVASALGGHPLGNIPANARGNATHPRTPDAADLAVKSALRTQAQLLDHTDILNTMRDSYTNKILTAQIVSASAPNSGTGLWWIPTPDRNIKNDHCRMWLRQRLGVPPSLPMPVHECDCRGVGYPQRALDVNDFDLGAEAIDVQVQTLHGLICRKPQCVGRIMRRHREVAEKLAEGLRLLDGVHVRFEVPMGNGQHKADLEVTRNGERFLIDVCVTCPATLSHVTAGSDRIQGTAANKAHRVKLRKYAPVLLGRPLEEHEDVVPGFIPFVVETGGFIHPRSTAWLDALAQGQTSMLPRIYNKVAEALTRHNGCMLAKYQAYMMMQ